MVAADPLHPHGPISPMKNLHIPTPSIRFRNEEHDDKRNPLTMTEVNSNHRKGTGEGYRREVVRTNSFVGKERPLKSQKKDFGFLIFIFYLLIFLYIYIFIMFPLISTNTLNAFDIFLFKLRFLISYTSIMTSVLKFFRAFKLIFFFMI